MHLDFYSILSNINFLIFRHFNLVSCTPPWLMKRNKNLQRMIHSICLWCFSGFSLTMKNNSIEKVTVSLLSWTNCWAFTLDIWFPKGQIIWMNCREKILKTNIFVISTGFQLILKYVLRHWLDQNKTIVTFKCKDERYGEDSQ